ncbi:MAG: YqgE/AlgH family protein [Burkholderiales bacterium]
MVPRLNSFLFLFARAVLCIFLCTAVGASADESKSIFLVAKSGMSDPNFGASVVLVLQHDEGGTLGVIINRPTRLAVSQVFPHRENLKKLDNTVYQGGPVMRSTLLFVFRALQQPGSAHQVLDGVYMSADPELLERLLGRPLPLESLHLFAGHAGWAPGQLEMEIASGGWYVLDADAATVFDRGSAGLWEELVNRAMLRPASTGWVTVFGGN